MAVTGQERLYSQVADSGHSTRECALQNYRSRDIAARQGRADLEVAATEQIASLTASRGRTKRRRGKELLAVNPSNLAVELDLPRVMSSYIMASAFRERGNDPLTDTDTTLLFRYECKGSGSPSLRESLDL